MSLEISFRSKELRNTCESPTRAKRELGGAAREALQRWLADMEAVDTVSELFELGLEIENCAQEHGMLRCYLSEGLYLYCEVNHQSVPMNGEMVDWGQVMRLKVARFGGEQ